MSSDQTGTLNSAAAPEIVPTNRYFDLEVQQKHPQYEYFLQRPDQSFVQPPAPPPPFLSSYSAREPPEGGQRPRSITLTVAVILVLVTALVVGAAVGGGLGASLAGCDDGQSDSSHLTHSTVFITTTMTTKDSSTATVTMGASATTTDGLLLDYVVTSPLNIFNVEFDCSSLGATQTTRDDDEYTIYCGRDFGSGHQTNFNDGAGGFRLNQDMAGTIQYTFDSCLEACSSLNRRAINLGLPNIVGCRGLTFNSRLRENDLAFGANCWLKNGTPSDIEAIAQAEESWFLSARLE